MGSEAELHQTELQPILGRSPSVVTASVPLRSHETFDCIFLVHFSTQI